MSLSEAKMLWIYAAIVLLSIQENPVWNFLLLNWLVDAFFIVEPYYVTMFFCLLCFHCTVFYEICCFWLSLLVPFGQTYKYNMLIDHVDSFSWSVVCTKCCILLFLLHAKRKRSYLLACCMLCILIWNTVYLPFALLCWLSLNLYEIPAFCITVLCWLSPNFIVPIEKSVFLDSPLFFFQYFAI